MSAVTTTTTTETIDVHNPRTGEVLYTISEASEADIRAAYETAGAVSQKLAAMSVRERVAEAAKLKQYILDNKETIIDRVVSETGKSRMDALISEIFGTLDLFGHYEKNAEKYPAHLVKGKSDKYTEYKKQVGGQQLYLPHYPDLLHLLFLKIRRRQLRTKRKPNPRR